MSDLIVIEGGALKVNGCETVIIVPEIAAREAGFIKAYSRKDSGNAKHEYHALAQMVYFQFQDEELAIIEVESPVTISYGAERTELLDGLVLYREPAGGLGVLAHACKNHKKLLEAAYRYCTRWVRLDI